MEDHKTLDLGMIRDLESLAQDQGFDVLGFASAEPFKGYRWAESIRRDPSLSLPQARSMVIAGVYIGGFTLPGWESPEIGRMSRLVMAGFYADVVEPLAALAGLVKDRGYKAEVCDGFEDGRSIIPLKLAAVRAGLGWQGRHSLIISQKFGTFMAWGGLITDAELGQPVEPQKDRCGTCRACVEACPTGALDEPYCLDPAKCLSNLLSTPGSVPELLAKAGNQVLECEICQNVCPWNKKHLKEPLITPRIEAFRREVPGLEETFRLENLVNWTEADYAAWAESKRLTIPFKAFERNVKMAWK